MRSAFLKAKHWQLFLLTFGIPLIFQVLTMASMFLNISTGNDQVLSHILNYYWIFLIAIVLFNGVLFGWIWSIGTELQKWVPNEAKMKVKKFKILFSIPAIYILIFAFFMGAAFEGFFDQGYEPHIAYMGGIMMIIFPIHLFSMFCIFYSLYFVSKTLKTVELQRETSFSEFVGEFFMIWFYPVGIWIVQPRINKLRSQD